MRKERTHLITFTPVDKYVEMYKVTCVLSQEHHTQLMFKSGYVQDPAEIPDDLVTQL
jgi:hypothetical protein